MHSRMDFRFVAGDGAGMSLIGLMLTVLLSSSVACGGPAVAPPDAAKNTAGEPASAAADHAAHDHGNAGAAPGAGDPAAAGAPAEHEHAHDATGAATADGAARFAPEVFGVSGGDYGITFAPDGRTIYFTRAVPTEGSEAIYFTRLSERRWTEPQVAPFSGRFHDKEPYLSPDGTRLYFASRRPVRGGTAKDDFDLWQVELAGDRWGEPARLDGVSSDQDDDYPAVSAEGYLVFGRTDEHGNLDLWIASLLGGRASPAERLPAPINSVYPEADPWITPDGGSIVFSSPRLYPDSRGQGDLYVIHRSGEAWSEPVSLGPAVNSIAHEYGPALSADATTFYFSRGFGGHVWVLPASALSALDFAHQP